MNETLSPKPGYKIVKSYFKQHEEIPEDWDHTKLENRVDILTGFAFKSKFFNRKNGIPLIRIRNLSNKITEVLYDGEYDNEYIIHQGDMLVGMDGSFKPHIWQGSDALLNQRVCKITSNDEKLDQKYLFYAIARKLPYYEVTNVGTTVSHISKTDIEKIPISLPSVPEQQKIASVLSNMDSLIVSIGSELELDRSIKQGLMQKLLMKGIGHSKFKKVQLDGSIIATIPDSWNVRSLGSLSVNGTQNGYTISKNDYGTGIPIVGMTDLFANDVLEYSELKEVNLLEQAVERFYLKSDDLLFARRSLNVEGAGKCVLVPQINKKIIFESSIIRMTLDKNLAVPRYVYYVLNSNLGNQIITRIKQVVAVAGVKSSDIIKINLPLPSDIEEQKKITSILSNIDLRIQNVVQYQDKLIELKKGLMQKLLVGKIRIAAA